MTGAVVLLTGFLLDCLLGDPQRSPHPVRLMGRGIASYDRRFRKGGNRRTDFVSGMVLALLLTAVSFLVPFFLLRLLYGIHILLGVAVEALLCYLVFGARDLVDESMRVYRALKEDNLPDARKALSLIVGRDTDRLDEESTARAAVETVAENLTDGVIAPMLFMLVGGAPAGLLYKAINTMDSMIGYRNAQYEYFGKFAARLDDVANFIPARVAAFFLLPAAALTGHSAKNALRIYRRDRRNHKSPNSAQTESAFSGALGISLSGPNYYRGVLVDKPPIGDASRPVSPEDIRRTCKMMYVAAVLTLVFGLAARILIFSL